MSIASASASQAPRKAKWTPEEDEKLRKAVMSYGTDSWNRVAVYIPTRTGKQCRERWIGQLAPTVSKEVWLPEEDALLMQAHASTGNRWTTIALNLPGRSALSIKNRWHWLKRHSATGHPCQTQVVINPPDVFERSKPYHALFEPPAIDERPFGPAFQAFRVRMFMGTDFRIGN
jgi:hypothetical protein